MKRNLKYREAVRDARRVVVKLGSRVLVQSSGRLDVRRMRGLARDVAGLMGQGVEVVIVTSGAIAAGMEALRMPERPTALPDLQMAAAVGQSRLMARYDALFGAEKCLVGQMLLTHDDFHHKMRLTNARRTMENLLRNRVIPLVNENDVVADEEIRADIRLGDNDFLASLVVRMIRADLLVLLTTADGLRAPGSAGRTRRVRYLESITRETYKWVTGHDARLSRGGMETKLRAADTASKVGCHVVIADGRKAGVLEAILGGQDVGTLVVGSVAA